MTRPDPEQLAVAGGISGVLTTVIMAPGERIKCILQVKVFCKVFFWIAGCKSMMNDQPSLTYWVNVIVEPGSKNKRSISYFTKQVIHSSI